VPARRIERPGASGAVGSSAEPAVFLPQKGRRLSQRRNFIACRAKALRRWNHCPLSIVSRPKNTANRDRNHHIPYSSKDTGYGQLRTSSVPVQYRFSTGSVPVQYRFSTGSVPVQYRFSTSSVPVQYQFSTGSVPVQYRFSTGYGQLRKLPGPFSADEATYNEWQPAL
jgi:hypothetical protein